MKLQHLVIIAFIVYGTAVSLEPLPEETAVVVEMPPYPALDPPQTYAAVLEVEDVRPTMRGV